MMFCAVGKGMLGDGEHAVKIMCGGQYILARLTTFQGGGFMGRLDKTNGLKSVPLVPLATQEKLPGGPLLTHSFDLGALTQVTDRDRRLLKGFEECRNPAFIAALKDLLETKPASVLPLRVEAHYPQLSS